MKLSDIISLGSLIVSIIVLVINIFITKKSFNYNDEDKKLAKESIELAKESINSIQLEKRKYTKVCVSNVLKMSDSIYLELKTFKKHVINDLKEPHLNTKNSDGTSHYIKQLELYLTNLKSYKEIYADIDLNMFNYGNDADTLNSKTICMEFNKHTNTMIKSIEQMLKEMETIYKNNNKIKMEINQSNLKRYKNIFNIYMNEMDWVREQIVTVLGITNKPIEQLYSDFDIK